MHHRSTTHHCRPFRRLALVVLAAGAFVANGSSLADDDHDRARKALEAGEVLSLRTILERVERDFPGQVIDVELEQGHGHGRERWIYEIKILRPGGALMKLKVDARDGSLINRRGRAGDRH